MAVLVGKQAPDFKADALMPDGSFKSVSLAEYKGKHLILFFYPLDFTFVCPTEIIAFSENIEEFKKRGVEILGCSVDSKFSHLAWRNTARSEGGIGQIKYPLLADLDKKIAEAYDVLAPAGIALRGLFLIDRQGVVQHQVVNNAPLGRSTDEALRMASALQYFEKNGEVCPVNFKEGDKGMKPDPEKSKEYFKKKFGK